jgi:L-lactate dehydrogenase (cytochrome)
MAKSFLSERTSNYYSGYSLDGFSVVENSSSFRKCRLLPRIMLDVTTARPQTTIFGVPSALPIYIAPASNALLGHPDGELNLTRGVSGQSRRMSL